LPTQRILDHCGLRAFFEVFVSPDSRTPPFTSKVEATQTLIIAKQVDRRRALFVGDTAEDARVAQACGLSFVAFRAGYGWEGLQAEGMPSLVCDHFDALPPLLEGLDLQP